MPHRQAAAALQVGDAADVGAQHALGLQRIKVAFCARAVVWTTLVQVSVMQNLNLSADLVVTPGVLKLD